MKYSNPQIPEGINTSKEHPLKEFVLLTAGVAAVVVATVLLLGYLADTFAYRIPFSVEKNIVDSRPLKELTEKKPAAPQMSAYLNELAAKLAAAQHLPKDMTITVHYVNDEMVNAFATLGGNVIMFRGLLEKLPNENALAMVLAHEIAHIKHRDPIRSMGRGVVIGLVLSMVSATLGNTVTDKMLAGGGMLTVLHYSRDQENAADETALDALRAIYGHLDGASDLFTVLEKASAGLPQAEFFSSHPLTQKRIERIQASAATLRTAQKPQLQPLPAGFATWMNEADAAR